MARDDARLDSGYTRFARDDSGIGNSGGAQAGTQGATRFIFSDNAKRCDLRAQRSQICCNVSGAAKTFTLLGKIHDRNGCLRRQSRRCSPQIAIEHQIAKHADRAAFEPRQ
jgi:hypothetical protein